MPTRKKLNGSVDRLANALREVFTEAVETALEPVHDKLKKHDQVLGHHGKVLAEINNRLKKVEKKLDIPPHAG